MSGSYVELLQAFSGNLFICVLALLGSLLAVVALHELGHYGAARLCGVRIQKFSIGFGKEVIGRTDKHGTRWSLSRIPLGGYVQIFGDVDHQKPEIYDPVIKARRSMTAEEIKEAFFAKPVWQRIFIVAAGPAVNFILTILILFALFSTKGQISTYPVVASVALGTSGYEAGFRPFDEIISIDGRHVLRFEDVWDYTKEKTGVPFHFKVKRGEKVIDIIAASRPIVYTDDQGISRAHGRLGATHITALKLEDIRSINGVKVQDNVAKARELVLANLGKDVQVGTFISKNSPEEDVFLVHIFPETNKDLSDPKAEDYDKAYFWKSKDRFYFRHEPLSAFKAAWMQLQELVSEATKMLGVLLAGGGSQKDIGGVVTMGGIAGKSAQSGLYTFLIFVGVLSAQIAYINLLPVPVLDGGYLVFLFFELMTKKRVPERLKEMALYGGMVILFGIMIIANLNDIFQMTRP